MAATFEPAPTAITKLPSALAILAYDPPFVIFVLDTLAALMLLISPPSPIKYVLVITLPAALTSTPANTLPEAVKVIPLITLAPVMLPVVEKLAAVMLPVALTLLLV